MVSRYIVRVTWPVEQTPDLDVAGLLEELASYAVAFDGGGVITDVDTAGGRDPYRVCVIVRGESAAQVANAGLALVEAATGARATRFEVMTSEEYEDEYGGPAPDHPDGLRADGAPGRTQGTEPGAPRRARTSGRPGFPGGIGRRNRPDGAARSLGQLRGRGDAHRG